MLRYFCLTRSSSPQCPVVSCSYFILMSLIAGNYASFLSVLTTAAHHIVYEEHFLCCERTGQGILRNYVKGAQKVVRTERCFGRQEFGALIGEYRMSLIWITALNCSVVQSHTGPLRAMYHSEFPSSFLRSLVLPLSWNILRAWLPKTDFTLFRALS